MRISVAELSDLFPKMDEFVFKLDLKMVLANERDGTQSSFRRALTLIF